MPKKEEANKETLAIDATCAPVNIWYPQDISLLNEAREKLKHMIYSMRKTNGMQLPYVRRDFGYLKKYMSQWLYIPECQYL